MSSNVVVDFAAVNRVARRVDLDGIRLLSVNGSLEDVVPGPLEPAIKHNCIPIRAEGRLDVVCSYSFAVRVGERQIGQADFQYLLTYSVLSGDDLAEEDVEQFAFANGTYHSWPFVREFLFNMTARMGLPPLTLPVFHFNPKPPARPASEPPAPSVQTSATQEPVAGAEVTGSPVADTPKPEASKTRRRKVADRGGR